MGTGCDEGTTVAACACRSFFLVVGVFPVNFYLLFSRTAASNAPLTQSPMPQDLSWFLTEGLVPLAAGKAVPEAVRGLCRQLAPHYRCAALCHDVHTVCMCGQVALLYQATPHHLCRIGSTHTSSRSSMLPRRLQDAHRLLCHPRAPGCCAHRGRLGALQRSRQQGRAAGAGLVRRRRIHRSSSQPATRPGTS